MPDKGDLAAGQRTLLLLLAVGMLLVGLPLTVFGSRAVLEQQREGRWVAVQAEVVQVRQLTPAQRDNWGLRRRRGNTVYPVVVHYAYEVDGQRYRSNIFHHGHPEKRFSHPRHRARWVANLEQRGTLVVHHHPEDPSRASVQYQPSILPVALALAGALLVMLSMPMFILHSQSRVSRDR